MAEKRYVSYISDDKLLPAVQWILDKTKAAISQADKKLDKNRLDPFSALFDSVINGLSYDDWLKKEIGRQIQKTMQNAIGEFHQKVIGGIDGWEDLEKGDVADVRCQGKRILGEVKNKFNTCKGSDLIEIYDELDRALVMPQYKGWDGYYVTVIAKRQDYRCNFTPSDRATKSNRPSNPHIVEISGHLFYDLASDSKDALFALYKSLPIVLEKEFGFKTGVFKDEKLLKAVMARTYASGGDLEDAEENGEE